MQVIYINGMKASKADVADLVERVRKGLDFVIEMHFTKSNNIAIKTI